MWHHVGNYCAVLGLRSWTCAPARSLSIVSARHLHSALYSSYAQRAGAPFVISCRFRRGPQSTRQFGSQSQKHVRSIIDAGAANTSKTGLTSIPVSTGPERAGNLV